MTRKVFLSTLILVLLMTSFTMIYGEEMAMFTNAKDTAPHLYITKHVESAGGAYAVPEAKKDKQFGFVLKLKGILAADVEYRVFGADGKEIFNEISGTRIPYRTSSSGDFTLKDGETALFEYVGAGVSYEITETEPGDGFTQTFPAGGLPAIGTVLPDGSSESFTNTYIPETSGAEDTILEVTKSTVFPAGYTAPTSPDFTFRLSIDGKAYANQAYSVINTKTGIKIGSGVTTAEGIFTLKGDQRAKFEHVPVNVDYEIVEESTAGWRAIGTTTKEGATKAPLTSVDYTNSNVSFGVSKTLTGNITSDDSFVFTLTDGLKAGIAEAEYYLYNTDGTRVDDVVHKTDADGNFMLKANQAAIFTAMPNGTVYNVSERADPNYIQTVPVTNEGYVDKVIGDSFEMLPFVNTLQELTQSLTVTKTVVPGNSGKLPTANDQFTFVLSQKTDSGYIAVPNAVYTVTVGASTGSYKTDEDGKFKIRRNETAVFSNLPAGETYRVKEVDVTTDYIVSDPEKEAELTNTENLIFENIFEAKTINLVIKKTNNSRQPLSGAEFNLYTDIAFNNQINQEPLVSDEDGKIAIPDIAPGTYYLREMKAPAGYQLLKKPIKIEITRTIDGLDVQIENNDSITTEVVGVTESDSSSEIEVLVTNNWAFWLPFSGGKGNAVFFFLGILIVIGASVLAIRHTIRSKERGSVI